MQNFHLIIYGVGAVGGFYGGLLQNAYDDSPNIQVSFIARGQIYQSLLANGLQLIQRHNEPAKFQDKILVEKNLKVYSNYSDIKIDPDAYTIVLLCVKCKDTLDSSKAIAKNFNNKTVVLSIQNGIDNEEKISSILGKEASIGALTNIGATILEPGIYLQTGSSTLTIGELAENYQWRDENRIEVISRILKEANIKVKISTEIKKAMWSKLVWNAAFNPLSVLYEARLKDIFNNENRKNRVIKIMEEVLLVAKAHGIELDQEIINQHINNTNKPEWDDFRTSSLQDFQRARPIELEELLGIIVNNQYEIKTPEAKLVYDEIKKKLC